jgi:hypothetical protein
MRRQVLDHPVVEVADVGDGVHQAHVLLQDVRVLGQQGLETSRSRWSPQQKMFPRRI